MNQVRVSRGNTALWAAVTGVLLLSGCNERSNTSTEVADGGPARSIAQQGLERNVRGDVSFTLTVYQSSGGSRTSIGLGRIDQPLVPNVGVRSSFVSRGLSKERSDGRLANKLVTLPTFGATSSKTQRSGRTGERFGLPTRRLGRQKVDGHDVEQFMIHEGGKPAGKPLGIINQVDGRMRQIVEFTSIGGAQLPTSARMIQLDASGRVESETTLDLSKVSVTNRLAAHQRPQLLEQVGRLLRNGVSLVLPDALHAQAVEDDPCAGWEQAMVGAVAVAATAASAASIAAGFCTVALFTCEAYLVASAAAIIAAAAEYYCAAQLAECRDLHPACFSGGWMTNGSCAAPGSGGGWGGGGGGGGGGVSCIWYTEWYIDDNGVYVTHSWVECI